MIRLGLRLAIAGGREAFVRLITIAAAVALGVGLVLATLAAMNAVHSLNHRYAWMNTGLAQATSADSVHADPLWWAPRQDYFDAQSIARIDLAATGPDSPMPPGLSRLPGPGEYFVSPKLHDLLAATPAEQLGDRYPGHEVGIIGDSALPSPTSLVIIIGHDPAEAAKLPEARQVSSIFGTSPEDCASCLVGYRAAGFDLILGVVAGALLFPVLIFIGTATRLTAARREQRYAAMRLIGATSGQISKMAVVEAAVAAVIGTFAGFAVFLLVRQPLAAIPFTGDPFYPEDMTLSVANVLWVALGVPVAALAVAWLSLRRVRVSPLGVTRRVTPKPPRAYRLIPLLAGLAWLYYLNGHRPRTSIEQVAVFLPGFLVVMSGLVIAGPWFTMVGSRLLARRAQTPSTLIAARRLSDNPQGGFRAVSGLVLALFVTSVAVGVIGTITSDHGSRTSRFDDGYVRHMFWAGDRYAGPTGTPAVTAQIEGVPGVTDVFFLRANPNFASEVPDPAAGPYVMACSDLARHPELGSCPAGAAVVAPTDFAVIGGGPAPVWPAVPVTPSDFEQLPIASIQVANDGSTGAVERTRTLLEAAYPDVRPPYSEKDFTTDSTKMFAGWVQLANVVILASLPIAGCSLAASVAGGLSDRKRPFSLLRLTGVSLRTLRRVVLLESVMPLLVVAAVAIVMGLVSAQLFLRAQMETTLVPPGWEYYVMVAAGLVLSLAVIAGTLPLLTRMTGPEVARNE
ncbi:MAG: FtsX-like permease family protein [Hamadaea sp.]|uniref:FtsX-like permease family protein n=1 Tax=Hamadaea sp. TaxID=2024425 RepID=UPI00184D8BF3|nr:FtsX-like permease family protein [Hamadaea sp.]NUR70905.1 FtsX-like permease family protein [Hamadaea sp.]NUT21692.1 FtsX-like permease family protein [Hamadaea sp.]